MANPIRFKSAAGGQLTSPNGTYFGLAEAEGGSTYWAYLADMGLLPDGFMINGKISVTVASNNITVALKGRDGNNPSTTNPVTVWINGTFRRCTAALSVTKNAGTNWCNSGGAELATKEIDYFVYLVWNTTPATDIMDIGFSRIPYGAVYSDFSGTSTNEKYLAYGNASAPTSTDDCVNIGRFAATLSAGAGYTWTVPTYTSVNLIQHPIYETRNLQYACQWTSTGTQPAIVNGTIVGVYKIRGDRMPVNVKIAAGASTTFGTGTYLFSLPFTSLLLTNATYPNSGAVYDNSTDTLYVTSVNVLPNANTVNIRSHNTAGIISPTVPITFAASDQIIFSVEPPIA